MKKALTLTVAAIALFAASAIRAENTQDHGHEGHNHAKAETIETTILTIKGVALIELAHDAKDGEVTLSVMDEKKRPLAPTKAPRLNLIVDGKNKQIKTKAVKGETTKFIATDEVLKKKLNGKVAIKIAGTSHKIDINPQANCDHGHEGHSH